LKIGLKFLSKPVGMWKFFLLQTDKRISYQELEKMNIWQLSAKVANITFDEMHCESVMVDFKMSCFIARGDCVSYIVIYSSCLFSVFSLLDILQSLPISHHFHGRTALLVLRFVVVKWCYIKYKALPFFPLPLPLTYMSVMSEVLCSL